MPRDPVECKAQWIATDALAPDCDALACLLHCDAQCAMAEQCGDITDRAACTRGCTETPPMPCDPHVGDTATCASVRKPAQCSTLKGQFGPDYDCEHAPCSDDYDCPATHTCEYDRCYRRCLEDKDCASTECFAGHCVDPPGTLCNPEQWGACGSSTNCINVDARNLTSASYCSITCYEWKPCPAGFTCVDYECRF